MKKQKTIFACLFCLGLFPLLLIGQKQNNTVLHADEASIYMEKLGFTSVPGFSPTGEIVKDREAFEMSLEKWKIAHPPQSSEGKPHASSAEKSNHNDLCADAEIVSCGDVVNGSTVNATFDGVPFCGTSNTTSGVWYRLTPDDDACLTLSTCNQANYDTKISVFTNGCGALSCVAGQDDNISECGFDFTTKLTFPASGGTEYLILVHGFGSATGDFTLSIICDPPNPLDNVCSAGALAVPSVTPYDNFCASVQPGEPSPGPGSGENSCNTQDGWCSFETEVQNSIWFTFQAPPSGCVTIVASDFDNQLALWEADDCSDFASFKVIAANDDSGDDIIPGIHGFSAGIIEAACLTPGQTYYIQLDGFGGQEGSGEIHMIDCGNDPLEADAGDCQSRYLGYGPAEEELNYLCATASGGFPPYSYSWAPSFIQTNGECISVQPEETTTYTVTVTDSKGCTVEDQVTVNVIDLAAPCQGKKNLQVCHVPPGNPANEHAVCINPNAIPSHLSHGDRLGPCDNECLATNPNPFVDPLVFLPSGSPSYSAEKNGISASVFPNPFEESTTIRFSISEDSHASLEVFSLTGKRIAVLFDGFSQAGVEHQVDFMGNDLPAGIYFYALSTEKGIYSQGKLVLVK